MSTVGMARARLATMIRRGRSQVVTATHRLGLTATPATHRLKAGSIVIEATRRPRMRSFPARYSNFPTGRVK